MGERGSDPSRGRQQQGTPAHLPVESGLYMKTPELEPGYRALYRSRQEQRSHLRILWLGF